MNISIKFSVTHIYSVYHNNAEIGMYACVYTDIRSFTDFECTQA